jgi:hypothetical protein
MLGSAETITTIADALVHHAVSTIVIDPVRNPLPSLPPHPNSPHPLPNQPPDMSR